MTAVFVMMGVSGCGKTTVGEALAQKLRTQFYDGDDFHPPENVAKMSKGVPLNDDDRRPWLQRLAGLISEHLERGETAVLACSALKKRYRDQLRVSPEIQFVYLEGSFDLIWQRMAARPDHYMRAEMLQSQFAALEPPHEDEALKVDIAQEVEEIVAHILCVFGTLANADGR
jgi:gluconokinase